MRFPSLAAFSFTLVAILCFSGLLTAEEAISPGKEKLIREYLDEYRFKETVKAGLDGELKGYEGLVDKWAEDYARENDLLDQKEQVREAYFASYENVVAEYKRQYEEVIRIDEMISEVYIPIYDKYFSEEELRDLMTFLKSPAGKKFQDVYPALTREVYQKTGEFSGVAKGELWEGLWKIENETLGKRLGALKSEESLEGAYTEGRIEETETYWIYFPDTDKRPLPLIVGMVPEGVPPTSLMQAWVGAAERHKFLVLVPKQHFTGFTKNQVSNMLQPFIMRGISKHGADQDRVAVGGYSAGGMSSHMFSLMHPRVTRAIIINTAMMPEKFKERYGEKYPRDKIAVFLASPTDYRYKEMRADYLFLESLGWKVKWIEFDGGHVIAPPEAYEEAAQWLESQW